MKSQLRASGISLAVTVLPSVARGQAASGDIYVADVGSGTVKRISPEGSVSVFVSGFIQPSGLAFDKNGSLFVAGFGANSIVKVTRDGTKTTFAAGLT